MKNSNDEATAFMDWLFSTAVNAGDKALVSDDIISSLRNICYYAGRGEAIYYNDPDSADKWVEGLLGETRGVSEKTWANQLAANCALDILAPLSFYRLDIPVSHVLRALIKYSGLDRDIRVRRKGSVVQVRSDRATKRSRIKIDIHLEVQAVKAERLWGRRDNLRGY